MQKRVAARVSGRVQGVCFRASTQAQARQLGLVGWVQNTSDGAVELEAQGEASAVEALMAFCGRGPEAARVDALEQCAVPLVEGEREFSIRR